MKHPEYDVAIIGGGPAGLSAALILARCNRKVLVCDSGVPRNYASHAVHGFLTRDGTCPSDLIGAAREQLKPYKNVRFWHGEATEVRGKDGRFKVALQDGRQATSRKILIATGLADELPAIPDIQKYYGKSVFICPYCDGYEIRGKPVAVYGHGQRGFELVRALTAWTLDLVLLTDGPARLTRDQRAALDAGGIAVVDKRIDSLAGRGGQLEAIVLEGGERLARDALFFNTPSWLRSPIALKLGCEVDKRGGVHCDRYEATNVPGVHVAGNITRDVQLAIVAAAEGAKAAFGLNKALTCEDFDALTRPQSAAYERRRYGAPTQARARGLHRNP